ncbi:MAG: RecB-like helicase, partial [Hydrogenimonas sp.]|nr:RecB-like helicase [Hydrogenimonas sp.]
FDYWDYKKGYDPVVDIWFAELKEAVKRYYDSKEKLFLSRIFSLYKRYKNVKVAHMKRAGQLHFKDIEHLVYDLLKKDEFTDFLYFRLDARIGHILFDEFQDTSVTQYRIFEPIIEEIASQKSDRTFFYVGDTKQSIYRFRGGQKALFGYVAERFGVKVEHLQTNYRSKSVIVEFVNETFDYVKPPQLANKEGGYVKVSEGDPKEKLTEALQLLFEKGIPDEKIAILVHDNKEILEVGNLIKERFGKKISTHKRAKVTEQPSAKAIIELMRLIYLLERDDEGALHRLNFLSLINRPYNRDFKPDIKSGRAAVMVKEIMERYSLFDEAAMKLLEFAIPLNDLTEFIYEVEKYEDELPPQELEGINVLTIHKSKGLEFEYVIVMDRLGRGKSDTSAFIFDYEDVKLKDIRVKFKNREVVDEEYAAALAREKGLDAEDSLNRSYVAFTRAKEGLVILKNERSSVFNSLKLEECTRGYIGEWRSEKVKKRVPQPLSFTPVDYGRQEVLDELKKYEANDFDAIYLGLAVHYLFESEDFDALMNRYGALCDVDKVKRIVERSKANIEYSLLTEGRLYRELPFVYNRKMGVVDLFVDKGDTAVIIDYKTATSRDISDYVEQVRWYIEALSHLMPQKREISGYIYFLDKQKLVKTD